MRTILRFNRQLSRTYGPAILYVLLSIIGFMLNYFLIKGTYLYSCILALNVIALIALNRGKLYDTCTKGMRAKRAWRQ